MHPWLSWPEDDFTSALRRRLAARPPRPPPFRAAFRRAAILLLMVRRRGRYRFVLTERTQDMPTHSGEACFPGGSVHPEDADAAATALREAREEIGLDPARVSVLGTLDEYPSIWGFRVTPVVAFARRPAPWRADEREVADVFEPPLDSLLRPGKLKRTPVSRFGMDYRLVEYRHHGHRIWGLTAAVIARFLTQVFGVPEGGAEVCDDEWLRAFVEAWETGAYDAMPRKGSVRDQ